ncbi:uncharacterized protein [Apostichopus japonicus]|uniref:uncharacterized protein isoform X2 n=1 Tax=Stichopus japonicus TaxID=307972 RepID=UPI003AB5DE07
MMEVYYKLIQSAVLLLIVRFSVNAEEPVKVTLLATSYVYSGSSNNLGYQCYVSDPGLNIQTDVTMTSSRHVWTRNTVSQNPDPPEAEYKYHRLWPRYKVDWNDVQNTNDVFGVFDCTARVAGKKDTTVSHIRLRSDADILPANDLLSQTFNIGDTEVSINMMSPTGRDVSTFRWIKDNVPISSTDGLSNYTIMRPLQLDDAGVYECYIDGERRSAKQALNLLIVRACPATRWGPPDCLGVCKSCYNGGICDENTGECVCPPGFQGEECKDECGYNRFGDDCEFQCSGSDKREKCRSNLFCLRHPFGCRCVTGYKGIQCNEDCEPGTYGASCLQTCNCNRNQCNQFTGKCDAGCSSGWTGSNCQECEGMFYGSDCSQKCHCDKERCNRESGLCQTGGCLPQWVDLFPPFSCQTGLIENTTYIKQNPGISGRVKCVALEGPGGDVGSLDLLVSRDQTDLDVDGIVRESTIKEGSTITQTFLVNNVRGGDNLYCQLRKNDKRLAIFQVSVDVFELPLLKSTPEVVSIFDGSVTISWSPWEEGINDGDGPVVGYTLYFREDKVTRWSKSGYVSASEPLGYVYTNLEPETSYMFSVAAVKVGDGGEGPRGPSLNVTTNCKVPLSPFNVSAETKEGNYYVVIISWQLPPVTCSSGVTNLTIYYRNLSSDDVIYKDYINNTSLTQYTFTTLSRDIKYEVYITITTSGGESEKSQTVPVPIQDKSGPDSLLPIIGSSVGGCLLLIIIIIIVLVVLVQRRRRDRGLELAHERTKRCIQKEESSFENSLREEGVDRNVPDTDHDITDQAIPVYDNVQQPAPIPLTELASYITKCQSGTVDNFNHQFMLLKEGKQYQSTIGEKEENKEKNRFKNMLPYDHSRVVLESHGGDPYSDYYNANYIKGLNGDKTFIACQGPNKASINDFWRMIWQENVHNIVMLTNLVERGRDRCLQYWPKAEKESRFFGEINVTWLCSETVADFSTRTMTVTWGEETRAVRIFHFLTWPDMDIPDQPTPLITLTKKVKSVQENVSSPLVVHCSAGIGRTGTFIGLYTLIDFLNGSEKIDVFGYVQEMRENRIDMIQRPTQYVFLHECLLEEYLTGKTWITTESIIALSLDQNKKKIFKQLKVHSELDSRDTNHTSCPPTEPERVRFPDATPVSNKLLFARSIGKMHADGYINAFEVDSYSRRQGFIVTQSPLPNTVEDFWRLVFDWKCSLIVMLNGLDPNDETCVQYWPDRNTVEYGFMTVELSDSNEQAGYYYKHFNVSHIDSQRKAKVHQLQIKSWDENDMPGILQFIHVVQTMQDEYSSDSPVLVHCINTVGRSGVFLCVKSEIERMQAEQRVDIFNTVRQLRASNRHFMQSEEDYILCHQLLNLHVSSAELTEPPIYANLTEL